MAKRKQRAQPREPRVPRQDRIRPEDVQILDRYVCAYDGGNVTDDAWKYERKDETPAFLRKGPEIITRMIPICQDCRDRMMRDYGTLVTPEEDARRIRRRASEMLDRRVLKKVEQRLGISEGVPRLTEEEGQEVEAALRKRWHVEL